MANITYGESLSAQYLGQIVYKYIQEQADAILGLFGIGTPSDTFPGDEISWREVHGTRKKPVPGYRAHNGPSKPVDLMTEKKVTATQGLVTLDKTLWGDFLVFAQSPTNLMASDHIGKIEREAADLARQITIFHNIIR